MNQVVATDGSRSGRRTFDEGQLYLLCCQVGLYNNGVSCSNGFSDAKGLHVCIPHHGSYSE